MLRKLLLFKIILISLCLLSCGKTSTYNDLAESVIRFTNLSGDRLEMYPGQTFALQVRRTYRDGDFIREQWVTSECIYLTDDPNVAICDNTGRIKALNPGSTKIRAKFSQWLSRPDYCHVYVDVVEPPAPSNVVATESLVGKIMIYWAQVAGATGYVVERASEFNGTVDYTSPILETLAFEDTKVEAGKVYYYRVKAVFNFYVGKSSPFVSGKALAGEGSQLQAPKDVVATDALAGKIKIFWAPVNNATGYIVERSKSDGGAIDFTSNILTTTTFEDVNVTPGVTYYYRVRALLNSIQSPPSAFVPGKAI